MWAVKPGEGHSLDVPPDPTGQMLCTVKTCVTLLLWATCAFPSGNLEGHFPSVCLPDLSPNSSMILSELEKEACTSRDLYLPPLGTVLPHCGEWSFWKQCLQFLQALCASPTAWWSLSVLPLRAAKFLSQKCFFSLLPIFMYQVLKFLIFKTNFLSSINNCYMPIWIAYVQKYFFKKILRNHYTFLSAYC